MSKSSNSNTITCSAHSNIALIKYWGKSGQQNPINPSLSFTLKNSQTNLTLDYFHSPGNFNVIFTFEDQPHFKFHDRIEKIIRHLAHSRSYLLDYTFKINSTNTFPHSAGIASSASSMAALSMALNIMHERITQTKLENIDQKNSTLARTMSGSACRSIYFPWALWGEHLSLGIGNNDHSIPLKFPAIPHLGDSILVIDKNPKKISSSQGHLRFQNHDFYTSRVNQANIRMYHLIHHLKLGNWSQCCPIIKQEALTLHALMLSSADPFTLLRPNTLVAIEKLEYYQKKLGSWLTYTLDAGPNIHILYPMDKKDTVHSLLKKEFQYLCEDHMIIDDEQLFDTI